MKTAVVYSCTHTDPQVDNRRFEWLGKFIYDIGPDYVVDLGDGADMRSLNTYDSRYPQAVVAQSYEDDIKSYHDAQEKLRHPFRLNKKRKPVWFGFEGNHENRIKKAISVDPRLAGKTYGLSFRHLQTDKWFDEYHEYSNSAPAIAAYDGVAYSHYFSFSNYGTAASGVHHAYSLVKELGHSATCGHSHKRDLYFKDAAYPRSIIGAVVGCFKGKEESWAGQSNNGWWNGVVVKRNLEDGVYDPWFVSMNWLEKEYS